MKWLLFDGDIMVGAMSIRSENVFDNSLALFSTLTTKKGYASGNQIKLKVWDAKTMEFLSVKFNMEILYDAYVSDKYPIDDGKFSIANISKSSVIADNKYLFSLIPQLKYYYCFSI